MTKHLRTVVEVAVLGTIALSVVVFGMFVSVPILNFFGSWGSGLGSLVTLGIAVGWVFPLAAGFCYGYTRKVALHFAAVWIGWLIGWMGYGMVMGATILRHAHLGHHKPVTPWLWVNWLLSIFWDLLFALVPALATMLGQRIRVRAAQSR
jgi:hypothetical protein